MEVIASGIIESAYKNNARYQFSWEQKETGKPGISEISWELRGIGRSSSPTTYYAKCRLYINGELVYKNWDVSTSFKNSLKTSGTFQVNHNTNGEGSFNVWLNVTKIYDIVPDYGTQTISLKKNYPYTACGAPTTVSASGIVTPNGKFTIKWSGATNGVSNNIKSYQVYWRITAEGAAPSASTYTGTKEVDVTDGTTSGSYTVTLSKADRGHKVVCGVKALSSIDSKYDSGIKTGGSVTVNSQPAAPSVSVNKTIVPSSGDTVTFTVTAGNDSDTSQTKTLYYSTLASGPKEKITSPWSQAVSDTTTYYFWTYDGLEFSQYSTLKTITKNIKPTVKIGIETNTKDESGLQSVNKEASYKYVIAPSITITASNGQSNKKYSYYIDYGSSTSLGSRKTISTSDSSATKAISDIRTYGLGHESGGVFYKITVKCNDGIEDSSEVSSDIYYITKIPVLENIYNGSNFTNIDGFYNGTKATHFSKILGFRFQKDQGYNALRITGYPNPSSQTTINLTTGTYTQGEFTNSDSLDISKEYTIGLEIGNISGYFAPKSNYKITKIATVKLSNFKPALKTDSSFKFFTDTGSNYENTVGHSFNVGLGLRDFGINSNIYSYVKIESNGKQSEGFSLDLADLNESTFQFFLASQQLSADISSIFDNADQRNSFYPAVLKFIIKNDFGEEVSVQQNFNIDFREAPELCTFSIYPSKHIDYPIDKWAYLKEGMTLYSSFEVKSYNVNVTGQVEIKRENENWQILKTFQLSTQKDSNASPGFPNIYTISIKDFQVFKEIIKPAYNVSYRIILNSKAGIPNIAELYNDIPVRGHSAPQFEILSTAFDGSGLTVKYKFLDMGLSTDGTTPRIKDEEIKLYIKDGEEKSTKIISPTVPTDYFNNNEKTAIFEKFPFGENDQLMVALSATTLLSTKVGDKMVDYETSKESEKNQYTTIYNVTPTVAYRKNYLGINTLNLDTQNDAIILIGETKGRDTIYFSSAGQNLCKIKNFCIDCGSW